MIENHGGEEAVLLNVLDHHILRALMRHHANNPEVGISGLSEQELKESENNQARWDLMLVHCLGGSISLACAAKVFDHAPFELRTRFQWLDVPLGVGSTDVTEIEADLDTAKGRRSQDGK